MLCSRSITVESDHHQYNRQKRWRLAHLIYSPAVGGSEMVAADVCSRLDNSLFKPMVLFMYEIPGSMPDLLKDRGVASFNLRHTGIRRLFGPLLLALSLRRMKIDILHVHHIPLFKCIWPAARLAGLQAVVFTEHAKFTISRFPQLQEACRRAARQASCFTTVSNNLKEYFVKDVGISEDTITVIPNGVDLSRFKPISNSSAVKSLIPDGFEGPVIMCVGRLAEAKDYITLLSALGILRQDNFNPYLVIVGDGDLRRDIEKRVSEKGLTNCVHLTGTRPDVDKLLHGADLFVSSSKREGFPVSVLEAMASGLPVVATKVGGVPEMIQDGHNGLLVPPQNPDALAKAIARLLDDPELAADMGRRARQRVEEDFSLKSVVGKYSNIYLSLMKEHNL